ncbi:hypothetical protein ROHU_015956 [Labeo rohita]|uniref:Uncharacterized protein n=1 Tax=Labeo rohita TaxID=84645 RepID=A0A498NMW8_LABRO|nr:hypothetical protein ROHU_015956 [Labeo rohita]
MILMYLSGAEQVLPLLLEVPLALLDEVLHRRLGHRHGNSLLRGLQSTVKHTDAKTITSTVRDKHICLPDLMDVLQDFELLFGVETASKLLEKWDCTLKQKVIQEAKNLTQSPLLSCLIQSAENCSTCQEDWDRDMSSLLLLVYLLPPPSSGNKKFVKISVREALDRVVRFHKSCCSFEEVLGSTQTTQPYILAVGTSKSSIHDYYIAVDKWLIPCMAKSSLSAFDELFKVHYVFGISYDAALQGILFPSITS